MPNWNENTLTIYNLLDEEIEELKTHIEGDELFSHYFPAPSELEFSAMIYDEEKVEKWKSEPFFQELSPEEQKERLEFWKKGSLTQEQADELIARYGVIDGYNWNVNNWGTKWDITDGNVSVEGSTLTATFLTAWSPPVEGLTFISKLFPNATFTLNFIEEGMDFMGTTIIKNGAFSEAFGREPSEIRDEWMEENVPNARDEEGDITDDAWDAFSEVQYDLYEAAFTELEAQAKQELITA